MKVSLNWIKEFTDVDMSVDELVTKIGAQLGGVEEIVDIGKKYDGIAVVKVVSCEPHPTADKLKVCLIDEDGFYDDVERNADHLIQVVCGAPNVRAGMLAVWIPPGYTVPSTVDKDPLVLEAREIRGHMSNGMLASGKELGINDDHNGILEVDRDVQPGVPFDEEYKLDDHIIDIENKMFTHRPDCFGQLGVAREIAGISGQAFKSPSWYLNAESRVKSQESSELPLKVVNEVPELAPRFMAVVVNNIKIAPSPLWLQATLARVGVRAINNVVDITNYMMLLTAQPLHAFDYDKIKAHSGDTPTIGPRLAKDGEDLALLGTKKLRLTKDDIVIATDQQAVDLAGIMGGADTEVDSNTTAIVLTCSSFDMYTLRRAMMRHGVFTEAATRNTKSQPAAQCGPVFHKTLDMIAELCNGATQASETFDNYPKPVQNPLVTLDASFVNERLGLKLTSQQIQTLLENVEFTVQLSPARHPGLDPGSSKNGTSSSDWIPDQVGNDGSGEMFAVTAPFWRTDIEIPEDIVEEVGRLYGYDHLPLELPRRSIKPAAKNAMTELQQTIRSTLAKAGANELLTYSFVHGNLLDKVGQDHTQAFQIANALSPDLQYYRLSLTPSLLDKVHPNIKAGYDEFALFEIGKAHNKAHFEDDLPKETEKTALIIASAAKGTEPTGAAYYQARRYLDELSGNLGLEVKYEALHEELDYQTAKPFDHTRSAHVVDTQSGLVIGIIGEFRQSVLKALKLPPVCAGFELSTAKLLTISTNGVSYSPLPKFPKVEQDICLKVSADMPYQKLFGFVWQKIDELKPEHTRASLSPVDIYQREEDKAHKQITLRLSLASFEKTMTDPEVATLLDQVAEAAKAKLSAERI